MIPSTFDSFYFKRPSVLCPQISERTYKRQVPDETSNDEIGRNSDAGTLVLGSILPILVMGGIGVFAVSRMMN